MMSFWRWRALVVAGLVALAGASCGSGLSGEAAEITVDQVDSIDATDLATSVPTAVLSLPGDDEPAEEEPTPTPPPPPEPRLTAEPVSVGSGEAECEVIGVNFLDHAMLTFELVGVETPSFAAIDYSFEGGGFAYTGTANLGDFDALERARVISHTSDDLPQDVVLEGFSCEVIATSMTPIKNNLPIEAKCHAGELDVFDRLTVNIDLDPSAVRASATNGYLSEFSIALYETNGVRVNHQYRYLALPADDSPVALWMRTFAKVGSDIDLAGYNLSCAVFGFRDRGDLHEAPDGSNCTIDGVDGAGDIFGSVASPVEESADMWLLARDATGTVVGSIPTWVSPDDPDPVKFETLVPLPLGLDPVDLSCEVVGIEMR